MRGASVSPEDATIEVGRPVCPRCKISMLLERIESPRVGYDKRVYECIRCGCSHEVMVANDAFGRPAVRSYIGID